jgi:hypothetical protein
VRALKSFEKPSEHPTLEHLLISLKIFEASFTLGAFAPRRLQVAWKLQSEIVEAPRSLYYPCESSGNLLISRVLLETEVKGKPCVASLSLCGYLNNVDVSKPLWRA